LKGSVNIYVRMQPCTEINKTKLRIEVIDTGIGINKAAQEKIFDDFYQADSSIMQRFGGTGLGLAITRQLVTLQGGQIYVDSEAGKGSRFYFDLTYEKAGRLSGNENDQSGKKSKSVKRLDGVRVLLVEDILVNQKVAVSYLNHWNAEVVCANNGLEGLKLFHAHDFDVILMDLYMPVMNGFDAIKRIRISPKGKNIPIIALTASAETNTIKKAIDKGASACIGKPFNANQLLETIKNLVVANPAPEKTADVNAPLVATKAPAMKYISLKKIEDASLGKKEFITEMINLLRNEIPDVINECKGHLAAERYFDFSRSVHKLKNSMLMIGFDNLKKDLSFLQDMAEQKKELTKVKSVFEKVLKIWAKGEEELSKL